MNDNSYLKLLLIKQKYRAFLLTLLLLWIVPIFANSEEPTPTAEMPHEPPKSTAEWWDFASRYSTFREFKFEVDAGQPECFFEKLINGTNIYFNYEVLKGGDRNVDAFIRNKDEVAIFSTVMNTIGSIDLVINVTDVYSFCFENPYDSFGRKLIYFHLSTFIPQTWENFASEISKLDIGLNNFTNAISNVDRNVMAMENFISISNQHAIADFYILMRNYQYVTRWAILQFVVTIVAAVSQVYFVRRLFAQRSSVKPRA